MKIMIKLVVPIVAISIASTPMQGQAQLLCWNCTESPWDSDGGVCRGSFEGGSWQCQQTGTPEDHECDAWGTCAIMADWALNFAVAEAKSGRIPSVASPFLLVADDTDTWLLRKCDGTMVARLGGRQDAADGRAEWVALPSAPPVSTTMEVPLLARLPSGAVSQQ